MDMNTRAAPGGRQEILQCRALDEVSRSRMHRGVGTPRAGPRR